MYKDVFPQWMKSDTVMYIDGIISIIASKYDIFFNVTVLWSCVCCVKFYQRAGQSVSIYNFIGLLNK